MHSFKLQVEFLILIYIVTLLQNVKCVKFGEACMLEMDCSNLQATCDFCDIIKGGGCINGKCKCIESTFMVYNERLSECGIPFGSTCDENKDELSCLSGNKCVNNTCVCPPLAQPLEDGGCTGFKFDFCEKDSECSPGQFLSCNNGICDCQQRNHTVYEYVTGTTIEGCKIRAEENCAIGNVNHTQPCVSNSVCDQTLLKCKCNAGYMSTSHGICKKNYQGICLPEWNECNANSGLTCINGTCACDSSISEVHYDYELNKCISYVGELCGHFPSLIGNYDYNVNIECVKNAMCNGNDLFSSNVCECQDGYSPNTVDGKTCVSVTRIQNLKPDF